MAVWGEGVDRVYALRLECLHLSMRNSLKERDENWGGKKRGRVGSHLSPCCHFQRGPQTSGYTIPAFQVNLSLGRQSHLGRRIEHILLAMR